MRYTRFIAAALAAVVGIGALCGCSGSETAASSGEDKPLVITTIFPAYDFARQVFGDTAEVKMLLKPGQESHTYDPSAKDITEIGGCDLFVYNGGESDEWVESVLKAAPDVNTFRMTDAVELLGEEQSEGMQAEDNADEGDDEYDEHVWTSLENAAAIVRALGASAGEIFPENADLLSQNAEAYASQIDELDWEFRELLSGEERYFIFGDRFPLLYFFEAYGLNYYAAFPGCGSETEPSAQTVTFLLDKLSQDDSVKTVFCIELSGRKLADVLAEDSGLEVTEFHSCHNISSDDLAAGETYVSLMTRNLRNLEGSLGDNNGT